MRSAYFACQNADPSFTCDVRVPTDYSIFLMKDKYGSTRDESGRLNLRLVYRDNVTLAVEKGGSICCFTCQDEASEPTHPQCSMLVFSPTMENSMPSIFRYP